MEHLCREDTMGFETETTVVSISANNRRNADPRLVARVVGADLVAENGSITMKGDRRVLKPTSPLIDEQRSRLKQLITKQAGTPSIKTTPKPVFEEA